MLKKEKIIENIEVVGKVHKFPFESEKWKDPDSVQGLGIIPFMIR